jgi:hypothetical protein
MSALQRRGSSGAGTPASPLHRATSAAAGGDPSRQSDVYLTELLSYSLDRLRKVGCLQLLQPSETCTVGHGSAGALCRGSCTAHSSSSSSNQLWHAHHGSRRLLTATDPSNCPLAAVSSAQAALLHAPPDCCVCGPLTAPPTPPPPSPPPTYPLHLFAAAPQEPELLAAEQQQLQRTLQSNAVTHYQVGPTTHHHPDLAATQPSPSGGANAQLVSASHRAPLRQGGGAAPAA